MLVECIRDFKDMAAGVMRQAGEQYDVDEERFAALNATRYGQLVKAVEAEPEPEPEPEPEEAAKPKRRTARKKADEE